MPVPAGWYEDPHKTGRLRHWDGSEWVNWTWDGASARSDDRGSMRKSPPAGPTGGVATPLPPAQPAFHVQQDDPRPACPACGTRGSLVPRSNTIKVKRRVKFGLLWVVLTVITGGIGLIVWLIMPRRTEVVSVDRFNHCTVCRADSR